MAECKTCGTKLSSSTAYKDKRYTGSDGYRPECKACTSTERANKSSVTKLAEKPTPKTSRRKDKIMRIESAPRHSDVDRIIDVNATQENTDYLLQAKPGSAGFEYDYGLYIEAAEKDAHLHSILHQRKSQVMSRRREFLPADDSDDAVYAAEFVRAAIENISMGEGDCGFERDLSEFLDAIKLGISFGEVLWDWEPLTIKNPASEKAEEIIGYVPTKILSRHPRRFKFDRDGNPLLKTPKHMQGETVPDYKFLIFRPFTQFEDPYGWPHMRIVWWLAWSKREVWKMWMRYTGNYTTPLMVAEQDDTCNLTPDEMTALKTLLERIQQETGLVVPPGLTLEFKEPNRSGSTSVYREYSDWADAGMSKAIIGQTMTTEAGHRGARSLGEVQRQTMLAYTTQDARALMALVNGTLIPWIMQFNLPGYPMPRLDINTEEVVDKLIEAQMLSILQGVGVLLSQRDVLRKLNVPMATTEADTLQPPTPPQGAQDSGLPPSTNKGDSKSGSKLAAMVEAEQTEAILELRDDMAMMADEMLKLSEKVGER